jgi:sugar lactone lactonase YvrE
LSSPRITSVHPAYAIEGGRVTLQGTGFTLDGPALPEVRIADRSARVVYASPTSLVVLVPAGITESGPVPIQVDVQPQEVHLDIAAPFAIGLHQVDNPVFDRQGNLYVTYSGTRGQQVPVSIFRVRPNGTRETFSSSIVNPTSMAIDADGRLFVSSRFEGVVYVVPPDGQAEPFASDLGVACGLAFTHDGMLMVGDRSGTIFKVDRSGHATMFATLPSSVAAFHLAIGPDRALYVTGPTLSPYDAVYRIDEYGKVTVRSESFGRPQGIAFDRGGNLTVIEALAGASGLYRLINVGNPLQLVLAGPGLVGVAYDLNGGVVVCTNDTAYRLQNRT